MPLSRSNRMPLSRALFLNSSVVLFSMIIVRSSSSMIMNSNSPTRPLYPVLLQLLQPAPLKNFLSATSSAVSFSSNRSLSVGGCSSRHSGQILRTNRCAKIASTVAVIKNAGTPMSFKRVTVLGASLVCNVLKTMWPVRAALMAISAVS